MTRPLYPSTSLIVRVTDDEAPVVQTFDPPETMRLDFVIARCTDPAGLDACSLVWRMAGNRGSPFWAPSKTADDHRDPRLSMICPPELYRADQYPSPFRGLVVNGTKRYEVVVTNRDGAAPYEVELTFYGAPVHGIEDTADDC